VESAEPALSSLSAAAFVEVLACLADRDARPARGGADAGDRRVHGVLPEVVGLPVGDLLQQVRFGPAADRRRGQDCALELGVLPSAEGALGQVPLAQSLQGQRLGPAGPAPLQRVRGEVKEHLAGERVVSRVQGRKPAQHLEDVSIAGEPVEQGATGCCRILVSRALLAGRVTTVDQNRQPQAAFTAVSPAPRPGNAVRPAPSSRWVITFQVRDARTADLASASPPCVAVRGRTEQADLGDSVARAKLAHAE
jgi:hypothetical protein